MVGIMKYSKHAIELREWTSDLRSEPDLVYYHYGALACDDIKTILEHPKVKVGVGVLGLRNFNFLFIYDNQFSKIEKRVTGVMGLGDTYVDMIKSKTTIPVYNFEVGVDLDMFKKTEPPKNFCIGMAEIFQHPEVDSVLKRFISYPFPKKTSCEGIGTDRAFTDMPDFYSQISVFIDNVTDPRPGGMMFLEAGAVGRPVICMKSGIYAKWFPEEWLAVDDKDVVNKITSLRDDQDLYKNTAEQWYNIARSRSYEEVTKEFDYAFDKMLEG